MSAILEIPANAKSLLVFAHGAGAGMEHATLSALAGALHNRDIATFRFQFPYMERGSKRPDSPDVAVVAIAAAVKRAAVAAPKLPLFAGGRSFGGRMTTTAASRGEIPTVKGIICFGFPLHPAKKPATTRASHLAAVSLPMLMIQGTRDDLADMKLMKEVVKAHRRLIQLHVVEGADHSFAVLKSSGRTSAEILSEVAGASAAFCSSQS